MIFITIVSCSCFRMALDGVRGSQFTSTNSVGISQGILPFTPAHSIHITYNHNHVLQLYIIHFIIA
jgi:hypothetical protein